MAVMQENPNRGQTVSVENSANPPSPKPAYQAPGGPTPRTRTGPSGPSAFQRGRAIQTAVQNQVHGGMAGSGGNAGSAHAVVQQETANPIHHVSVADVQAKSNSRNDALKNVQAISKSSRDINLVKDNPGYFKGPSFKSRVEEGKGVGFSGGNPRPVSPGARADALKQMQSTLGQNQTSALNQKREAQMQALKSRKMAR